MIQRIFLRRRFSRRALCVAYNAYNDKLSALKEQQQGPASHLDDALLMDWHDTDDGFPSSKGRTGRYLHLDLLTSLTELPSLVLDLCESTANFKLQEGTGLLGSMLGGAERDVKHRAQHLHYLEDSFAAFLHECELATERFSRLHAGCLAGVVRGGLVLAAVAHRGGDLSLIQDSNETADKDATPLIEPSKQARALLNQLEAQYSSNASLASAFLELDCLLSSFVQEGDLSATGVQWIEQYFTALSLALRDMVPQLVALLLQSVTATRFSCFDALLSFDDPQVLATFADRAFQKLNSPADQSEQQNTCDEDTAVALVQEVSHLLRQRLRKVKLVLGLLYLLKDVGQAMLSGDVYAAILDVYIPKVGAFCALLFACTFLIF